MNFAHACFLAAKRIERQEGQENTRRRGLGKRETFFMGNLEFYFPFRHPHNDQLPWCMLKYKKSR